MPAQLVLYPSRRRFIVSSTYALHGSCLTCHTDADIVCARSKNHFSPEINLEDTEAESQTSQSIETQLERYKREYKPLHDNMSRNMYFMVCFSFDCHFC